MPFRDRPASRGDTRPMDTIEPLQEVKRLPFSVPISFMLPQRLVQIGIRLGSRLNEPQEPIRNRITDRIPEDVIGRGLAVIPDRQGREEVRHTDRGVSPIGLCFIEEGIEQTEPEDLCRSPSENGPG